MNLKDLCIPAQSSEMIEAFHDYYAKFHHELMHMSNSKVSGYVQEYIDLLGDLSKSPSLENNVRAEVGVLSLHQFGYANFEQLSAIFDRTVPQNEPEFVTFSSWVAGKLTHHPDIEQSRYVQHLLERTLGWMRAKGRRARPLAAAQMIEALSMNAGSGIIGFLSQFQSSIWLLVSQRSKEVLKATAKAIAMFTRAIVRYARGDLEIYLAFLTQLSIRLLSFWSPIRIYAALILFEQFLDTSPGFFMSRFMEMYTAINDAIADASPTVQAAGYVTLSHFAVIDARQFVDIVADDLFDKTKELIVHFPSDIVRALGIMVKNAPDWMEAKLDELKELATLILSTPDCSMRLIGLLVEQYGGKVFPIDEKFLSDLMATPMSDDYCSLFIKLSKRDEVRDFVGGKLLIRIKEELKQPSPIIAITLISEMPPEMMKGDQEICTRILELALSDSVTTRSLIPSAAMNLAKGSGAELMDMMINWLLPNGVFDESPTVRNAIMKVFHDNITKDLAKPENMRYFQSYTNDESTIVRRSAFAILEKVAVFNPLFVASIIRCSLLDCMFIMRNIASIRQKARSILILPELIKASGVTIKAYSEGLMEIAMTVLGEKTRQVYDNFLEGDAHKSILINIINSISVLAPVDPDQVAMCANEMIPLLCEHLTSAENRRTALAIVHLFSVLLTAPASRIEYREKAPLILSTCSKFLAATNSRKVRMAILKVIGLLGVVEVHQQPLPKLLKSPENIDSELARQFFHPSRDSEEAPDDSQLQMGQNTDQYYLCVIASRLLECFRNENLKDLYHETVNALVSVLSYPRMAILSYFDAFCTRLIDVMEEEPCDERLSSYVGQFTRLVMSSTYNTSPFIQPTLNLIRRRFSNQTRSAFLDLILALVQSLRDGIGPWSSEIICLLVICLDDTKSSDVEICHKALKTLSAIGVYTTDLLYLIVPTICEAICYAQTLNEVKVVAMDELTNLAKTTDIFPSIGTVIRAITCGIGSDEQDMKTATMHLVYVLLKVYGTMFLNGYKPLFESIRRRKLETLELKRLITAVNQGKFLNSFSPIDDGPQKAPPKPEPSQYQFNADIVISRVVALNIGGKHVEKWLRSLLITLISNSPVEAIRNCSQLANQYYPFALGLFKIAFYSCWTRIKKRGMAQIANTFRELLNVSENCENVVREIIDLIVFMDKIEQPIDVPLDCVIKACLRYGREGFALHLQQRIYDDATDEHVAVSTAQSLMDVYVQLGDWSNAIGIWNKRLMHSSVSNRMEIMSKLHMWDMVEPLYRSQFMEQKDIDSLYGLIVSLASMATWDKVIELVPDFKNLRTQEKRRVAIFFAEAAMNLRRWDLLGDILGFVPEDNEKGIVISAMNAIHNGQYDQVRPLIDKGFSLLASQPITFWADNQQIHRDTMLIAQQFVELDEIKRWIMNQDQRELEEVWNQRLKTAPRDVDLWLPVLANRIVLTDNREDNLIRFFEMKSVTLGTKLHMNAFDIFFPDFNMETASPSHKLCHIVAHYVTGEKERAIEEIQKLAETIEGPLKLQCHYLSASWLLESDDSKEVLLKAYEHFEHVVSSGAIDKTPLRKKRTRTFSNSSFDSQTKISSSGSLGRTLSEAGTLRLPSRVLKGLTTDISNVVCLRKWADVNTSLAAADEEHFTRYVTTAIDALTQCAQISPMFPDVVQLLNLFFENADQEEIFNSTAHTCIEKLQPKLLLQASAQLLVQLSHPSPAVSSFVHDVLFQLLKNHYHDLIFSVIVMKSSKNISRARAAGELLSQFHHLMSEEYEEVELIRKSMLRAAVTWNEKIIQRITDAFDHYSRQAYDKMIASLSTIVAMVKKPKCEMHEQFRQQHAPMLVQLEHIIASYQPNQKVSLSQISSWCQKMQDAISEDLKRIHTIQLSSISPILDAKTHFKLAVPGTYKPGKTLIQIQYFVGQLNVYMSKQQPKDVVVMGEDGNFYQYLLKGHEDLRLDERIMQFFRLINSLLKKESIFNANLIEAMSVIPLSVSHGLVQWVRGTDTLRSIIEQYRTLHGQDPLEEYVLIEKFATGSFDCMTPIQKTSIIEQIFDLVPDTDLANFFWLKADNVETWMKQTNNFAISTAMTSIVGYIIGLGDRHPSNLLIDRFTGKAIHIDFGDCFERAAKRPFLPEVVPFRLTRMMVKAMGPAGVDGIFRTSFVNMSSLLRDNKRVLVMVLAIFVHEPLVDPEADEDGLGSGVRRVLSKAATGSIIDKGRVYMTDDQGVQSSLEMRNRVKQKLNGRDFEPGVCLSVEDQATRLIESATDIYALGKMYSGWCPFW